MDCVPGVSCSLAKAFSFSVSTAQRESFDDTEGQFEYMFLCVCKNSRIFDRKKMTCIPIRFASAPRTGVTTILSPILHPFAQLQARGTAHEEYQRHLQAESCARRSHIDRYASFSPLHFGVGANADNVREIVLQGLTVIVIHMLHDRSSKCSAGIN